MYSRRGVFPGHPRTRDRQEYVPIRAAGVGKTTIYRRWQGKEDLLVAALARLKTPLPSPAGESVRDDLIVLLRVACADMADPRHARASALLRCEGVKYPRLAARFSETVVEPRREVFRSVLRRGIQAGEVRAGTDRLPLRTVG